MYISGIAGTEAETPKQYVNLSFSSKVYNMPEFNVQAFILPKVTYELPTFPVNPSGWNHIQDLPLADPDFRKPRAVDALFGADVWASTIRATIIKGEPGLAIAQDSALG
ncbi:unnamed protein product, partial [Allacma fusca]